MFATTARRIPVALIGLAITTGLIVWLLSSGATGARAGAGFSSPLGATTHATSKIVEVSAPYTVSTVAVRTTTVAVERRQMQAAVVTPKKRAAVRRLATSTELGRAKTLLAAQIAQHPILKGTTVEFGDARGYQAISYYRTGRIVISKSHTASLSRIIAHEVWHVIDWRDNGRIDWGENIPR